MKIALCTRIRRANDFIKEYIDYYLNLGVDTIFIGDNNRIDDPIDDHNVKQYLKEYIDNNKVVYVDISKFKNVETCHSQFEHLIYNDYKNYYDYIMLFDYDEFLNLNGYFKNFKEWLEYLNTKKNVEQVILNWNIKYGSKQIENEPTGKFLETYSCLKNQYLIINKCIFKTNLKNIQITNHPLQKFSDKLSIVNGDGDECILNISNMSDKKYMSKKITFDHYKYTSIERFVKNRICHIQNQLPKKTFYTNISYTYTSWCLPPQIFRKYVYLYCKKYNINFDLINDIGYIPDISDMALNI